MKVQLSSDSALSREINRLVNQEKAKILLRFFKTGPGEYGEGDIFLGINVPEIRSLAKKWQKADNILVEELLGNKYHEVRLLGGLILVDKYEQAKDEKEKKAVLSFYLKHRQAFNNWDLVDVTVYKIWGDYLLRNRSQRKDLFEFARSANLWERRMAVVATMALIKNNQFGEIFKLTKQLLNDQEDLIHKALGWMLREVGEKDKESLEAFLDKHVLKLPRTTLRYAIEKFSKERRKHYLQLDRVNI
jgi:3-methyladenine DNA glycosylase AlkD